MSKEIEKALNRSGAIGRNTFGVQFDLNAAWRNVDGRTQSASYCDHNCTSELGNYTCLAAASLNTGIRSNSLIPADTILSSFENLKNGIEAARIDFFDNSFGSYCDKFNIPAEVANVMKEKMDKPGFEVNLFGGNPELHPNITTIIRELSSAGYDVHLTTTGGRFMRDASFLEEILEHPPTLLALSADDFVDPDEIRLLGSLSLDELRTIWRKIPSRHGQRRKAHEAIYAARLASETEGFPPILFNMVLHPGNITNASAIVTAIAEQFPEVLINPFPAQNAFSYDEEPALQTKHGKAMLDFIDQMLEIQTIATNEDRLAHPYVPHLHYWLMLRAAFDWADDNPKLALKMISGGEIWKCFTESQVGFYAQIGLGVEDDVIQHSKDKYPGGFMGCFWNRQTVTDNIQVWDETMSPNSIKKYLEIGRSALAAASPRPCPGCAFPRLVGHIISSETGMDPRILPFYLERRKQALKF